jgi:glycerol-3-phosphate dehydrogenase
MNTPDKRSIFAVPREGFVYLGTTDTFYPNPEYWPEITAEDVDYLLETAGRVLDVGPLRRDEIVALWSGLRPLLGAEGKKPSEISRRDEVMEGPGGVLSIAGGKLTSYRSMAERLVDQCEQRLGRKPKPPPTAEEPLPGGDFAGTFEDLQSQLENVGLTPHEAERATRLYGSEASGIFAQGNGVAAEATYAVLQEGALTLEDYWVRRSARCLFDEEGGLAALEPAAERMGELLHWSEAERAGQVAASRARRAADMKVLEER